MKPSFWLKKGLWLVFLAVPALTMAQTPLPTSGMTPDQEMRFEDTHLISAQTGFFGIRYSLNGKEIHDDKELEDTIASVDDEQAVQYLQDSENHNSLGWIFIGSGSGLLVIGGFSTWSNGGTTLSDVLVLAGLTLDTLGGLFCRESQREELDAVNRYNQIVRQDNGISFLDLPNAPMGLAYVERV